MSPERPGEGGEPTTAGPPGEAVEGPLEDDAAVLREPVTLEPSLLDEAELDRQWADEPSDLAGEEDEEAAVEARTALEPPLEAFDETIEPEELEERLESEAEAAEEVSIHEVEPVLEALLDEGTPLEELPADAVADELELEREGGPAEARAERTWRPPPLLPRVVPTETQGTGGTIDLELARRRLLAERARLERLRGDLEEGGLRSRSEQEDLSELSAVDQHPADQGTETFDRERDVSLRDQVEGELLEIERALQRVEAGTYGRCEACGRAIGEDRLEAEPATRFCLEDQLAAEREAFAEVPESEA
jgi:RNA polymerase-binding transcription factor DksA